MQWWCSATGEPWTWAWQAYPGVWAFVALTAVAAWRLMRRAQLRVGQRLSGIAAIALLWLTLDWPVGPLGTGYLAWVHALQFVSLAMVVPPLLLHALPRERMHAWIGTRPTLGLAIAATTQPLLAAVLFTLTMVVTHVPRVVDSVMQFQLGAFVLDMAWLVSGLVFWWPIVVRYPEREGFNPIFRILYIFLGTQAHLFIAMWLLLSKFPVYATYELAPRVTSLSALQDQQVAGGIMIAVAEPIVFAFIAVVFFRWAREQQ
ncbi:MAG: cytochrome c oxidase assembly protein [Gemmatimonadaceae bacterium]|nr:cytochrome c oxidase assembly protein [Gemmatimonadaceae bacterium]